MSRHLPILLTALFMLVFTSFTEAQRRGRTRAATPAPDTSEKKYLLICEKRPGVLTAEQLSAREKLISQAWGTKSVSITYTDTSKKDYVIRRDTRTIPGERFSREDLIRAQREVVNLKLFDEATSQELESPIDYSTPIIFKKQVTADPEEQDTPTVVDCRETNAINKANVADAYPFLSADGLRLYFTSNREGGHGRFFISSRESVADPFREPRVLSSNLTDGYFAGTLTADELTLCMVKDGSMYISTRKTLLDEFSMPVRLQGTSKGSHFGPSISPDGTEIIVMVKGKVDFLRVYKRTGDHSVVEVNELPIPEGEPGPGQFSKNGLAYFFSIEKEDGKEFLWRYSRPSLKAQFADLQELPVQMSSLKNNLQPSVNADGTVLAFVTSATKRWEADDIIVISNVRGFDSPEQFNTVKSNDDNSMKVMTKIDIPQLNVFPNPFTAAVTIDMRELPAPGTTVVIYDLSGKRLKQERITSTKTTIQLDKLAAGIYIYHIVSEKGRLVASGKLVKGN